MPDYFTNFAYQRRKQRHATDVANRRAAQLNEEPNYVVIEEPHVEAVIEPVQERQLHIQTGRFGLFDLFNDQSLPTEEHIENADDILI
jgi:hypothetical protein